MTRNRSAGGGVSVNAPGKKPSLFQRKAGLPVTMLLGILVASLVWIFLPLNCGCAMGPCSSRLSALEHLRKGEKPSAYVAHAFGEIDGVFYTDTRDAFLLNYQRGFRTFEVDLVLLEDGSAFCAHDGAEWMYGLVKPFAETTAAELAGRLCLGKYTPLTGSDLLDLIDQYTDACFLLDAKRTTRDSNHAILEALVSEAKERHLAVLDRMIPHTFGPEDLWEVANIHPFRHYWAAVSSFRCNFDRSPGAEPDRVVLYIISRGGPLSLLRITDVLADYALLFSLRYPAFALPATLYDIKVYVSVDIMTDDPQPSPA